MNTAKKKPSSRPTTDPISKALRATVTELVREFSRSRGHVEEPSPLELFDAKWRRKEARRRRGKKKT